ncbi:helix-turn-helix domain-containing protein [Enterococcus casseliflavus]
MKIEINKKEVGQRIRKLRNSMGISMEKFGKSIDNLSRSTVNNWER